MSVKVLNPSLWPQVDQSAWHAAFEAGDIFDGRGPAAHWSAGSRRSVASGYGRWIGYLNAVEPDALELLPADRVTRERLRAYLDLLHGEITPAGVFNYAKHLYDAIRVMAPVRSWDWFKTIVWRLDRGSPRNKAGRMASPGELRDLGLDLMTRATSDDDDLRGAIAYRDGLIIALLASRPIRRRNLAAMRVGHHLMRTGNHWHTVFTSDETKTHEPYEAPLPDFLAPYVERYIDEIRCRIPGAGSHDGLWASAKGCPMTESWLYETVRRRTSAALGKAINLHLFRDIAATEVAYRAPERIGMARDLLGHRDLRAIDKHYIQASQIQAGRAYGQALLAERDDLMQKDRKHRQRT